MTFAGLTVLIVEDEPIIAFALEDMLADLGAGAEIASTIEDGFALLEKDSFGFAVLDVNVKGAKSYPIADELRRRSIPLIFATGYGDAEHPAHFAEALTLTKPYSRQQLEQAIKAATAPA